MARFLCDSIIITSGVVHDRLTRCRGSLRHGLSPGRARVSSPQPSIRLACTRTQFDFLQGFAVPSSPPPLIAVGNDHGSGGLPSRDKQGDHRDLPSGTLLSLLFTFVPKPGGAVCLFVFHTQGFNASAMYNFLIPRYHKIVKNKMALKSMRCRAVANSRNKSHRSHSVDFIQFYSIQSRLCGSCAIFQLQFTCSDRS